MNPVRPMTPNTNSLYEEILCHRPDGISLVVDGVRHYEAVDLQQEKIAAQEEGARRGLLPIRGKGFYTVDPTVRGEDIKNKAIAILERATGYAALSEKSDYIVKVTGRKNGEQVFDLKLNLSGYVKRPSAAQRSGELMEQVLKGMNSQECAQQ